MRTRERILKGLGRDGAARIEAAVRRAEKRTRAELVPAVALQSAPMGHAPALGASLLLLAWALGGWSLWRHVLPWGSAWAPWLDALTLGTLGAALASFPRVRAWLTPHADKERAVHAAAKAAFCQYGLDGTERRVGVLLYVSLAERRAVVLADKAIAAKLHEGAWAEVCDKVLAGAARGDLAGGYENALEHAAALLGKRFPAGRRDLDELSDRLRILP
jgi:putative membrane protein